MTFGEGGFRPKSPEELEAQFRQVQEPLGTEAEHSLVPPSQENILTIPLEQIKEKYTWRYEMYLKLLRARGREVSDTAPLTPADVDEMKKWLKALNSLDRYITAHTSGEQKVLRERQVPIFEDLRDFIEGGEKDGYVKLPTGVGKTVLFTELLEALDVRALIVVPTAPLVEQTEERIEEFAPDLDVGKIYAHAKERGRQVTIITYDSLVRQLRSGKIKPEDYDCLILDEAHTALSEKRSSAVGQFEGMLRLGFTATPRYTDQKQVSRLLETEIHSMTIREAVEEGLLCSFSAMIARTKVDLSHVSLTSTGEYNEDQLAKAVNIASRNQSAVELYKKAFVGESGVAYCVSIEHAETVAGLFNGEGVRAEVISGHTPVKEQRRLKKEFEQGTIKVLCNADILIPGFDEPRASVCLNLRPTRSRVIAEQRGGRVLRTYQKPPDKHARIVDFVDEGIDETHPPVLFADIAEGAQFALREIDKGGERGRDSESYRGNGTGKRPTSIIDISGLEVITDVEEIMRIVGRYREVRRRYEFLPFDEFQVAVRRAGITNSKDYARRYRNYTGWPSTPKQIYPDQWKSWYDFFGREKSPMMSYKQLQDAVRRRGIRSVQEYRQTYKKRRVWPANPAKFYVDQWPGWQRFLNPSFLGYHDLQEAVNRAGISSFIEYLQVSQKHDDWPSRPDFLGYEEWPGWDTFLEKEKLSFHELQIQVQDAGVTSQLAYFEVYKKHVGWPATPQDVYKDVWPGWREFLGTEKDWLSYEDLRVSVKREGIQSIAEYRAVYRLHIGWPFAPQKVYRGQWPGWPAFLGK